VRRHKPTGTALEEVVYPTAAPPEIGEHDRLLSIPLCRGGRPVENLPTLDDARQRLRRGLVSLPWEGLKLSHGEPAIPTVFLEETK
jgi:nicotinate phosphoribosyltransferase